MRKYLAELHKKPDEHKKRFALLVSGAVTLFIFGIWSLTIFGTSGEKIAENDSVFQKGSEEVSPLQSIRMNLGTSLEAIKGIFGGLKNNLDSVDLETGYKDMRDGALNTYGQ